MRIEWCLRKTLTGWLFVSALIFASAVQAQAQALGRIFSTPEERAYLNSQREARLIDLTDAERLAARSAPVIEIGTPIVETLIHLGGVVRRSDGTHTIWLNGLPVHERELPSNVRVEMLSGLGVLRVQTPTAAYSLRPGQTLNASTGELREDFELTPEEVAEVNAEVAQRAARNRLVAEVADPDKEEKEDEADVLDPEPTKEQRSAIDSIVNSLEMLREAQRIQGSLQ